MGLTQPWMKFRTHYRIEASHTVHMTYHGYFYFVVEVYNEKGKRLLFYPPNGLCASPVISYQVNFEAMQPNERPIPEADEEDAQNVVVHDVHAQGQVILAQDMHTIGSEN